MTINSFISPDRVACHDDASSRKRALEKLSVFLASSQAGLDKDAIFDKLLERERLGSTALGSGVAIPHCRLPTLQQAAIAFVTLSEGIDYDANDRKPVDLLFALIVPENCNETHLKILAEAAEMFSDSAFCQMLRDSASNENLYELITHWQPKSMTA